MHMRDQLSFTEVPKKYINANKKTEQTTLEKASGNKKIYIFSLILKRASLVPMSSGFLFHNLGTVNVRSPCMGL